MDYIQSEKESGGCVFCQAVLQEDNPQNLIVHRGKLAFVILNRFPYNNGHLMVVPYLHKPSIDLLDAETRTEIMELVNQTIVVLHKVYSPQGFNVGINMGSAAGAGIREHVHMHIVPRWTGDTNFMSTLGTTRVLPETLDETYWRICNDWHADIS